MTVIAVITAAALAGPVPPANAGAPPVPAVAAVASTPVAAAPQNTDAEAAAAEPNPAVLAPLGSDDHPFTIRAAYDAAESRQGPLDGRWRLSDLNGRSLFIFQLSDPGAADKADPAAGLEGAWRDPNRLGLPQSSGFLDQIDRTDDGLSLRFQELTGEPSRVVTLRPGPNGAWRGEVSGPGPRETVVMTRF